MDGQDVKSFQPRLVPYSYNEDIMVSDGWIIDGSEDKQKFCDIIPHLARGGRAKMKDWKEMFIYLDRQSHSLVLHSMDAFPFIPDFDSFVSEDWVEINNKDEE